MTSPTTAARLRSTASLLMSAGLVLAALTSSAGLADAATTQPSAKSAAAPTARPTPPFVASFELTPTLESTDDPLNQSLRSDLAGTLTASADSIVRIYTIPELLPGSTWTKVFEGSVSASSGSPVPLAASWLTPCASLWVTPRYLVSVGSAADPKKTTWAQLVDDEDEPFWAPLAKGDPNKNASSKLTGSPHATSCEDVKNAANATPAPGSTARPGATPKPAVPAFETDLALTGQPAEDFPYDNRAMMVPGIRYTLSGTVTRKSDLDLWVSLDVGVRDEADYSSTLRFALGTLLVGDLGSDSLVTKIDKTFFVACSDLGTRPVYVATAELYEGSETFMVTFGPAIGVDGPDTYALVPGGNPYVIEINNAPDLQACPPQPTDAPCPDGRSSGHC